MKKIICGLVCVLSIFSFSSSVLAETETTMANMGSAEYIIYVNNKKLDIAELPICAYQTENNVVMVPLRAVGEALGYDVNWIPESGNITMEDSVQKVVLEDNSKSVKFVGKLNVIDLSRNIDLETNVAIHQGHTYVPLSLFKDFFNEISVNEKTISVSEVYYELQ